MIQIKLLSGNQAGKQFPYADFPVVVGRSAQAQLRLDDPGVWDRHLSLALDDAGRFQLTVLDQAIASLNDEPVETAFLRNGDEIEIGSVRLQFWLGDVVQTGLAWRERLIWISLVLLVLVEFSLAIWLHY